MRKLLFAVPLLAASLANAQTTEEVIERMHHHEQVLNIQYTNTPKLINFGLSRFPLFGETGLLAMPRYCPLNETIYEASAQRDIDHELGHHYTNEINKLLGLGNFPMNDDCTYITEGQKLISEGIASYFEIRLDDDTRIQFNEFYNKSYWVVRPVLDMDVRKGVEYFLTHFPTDKEMKNLKAYRKKSIEDMSVK